MGHKIFDISRSLYAGMAVWPGDRPFEASWTAEIAEGSSVNVGAFATTTHAGTHADAPLHYLASGPSIDQLPLEAFVGPAWVVHVVDADSIRPEHVAALALDGVSRVLFRTRSSDVPDGEWEPTFIPLLQETVKYLASQNVVLIGTDAPSVDPENSTDLPVHHALARAGIVNLENLQLSDVPQGRYQLIALPLKLFGLDASPVRAILLAEE